MRVNLKQDQPRYFLKDQPMKCKDCQQDILQKNPEVCPYCKSKNLIPDEEPPRVIEKAPSTKEARRAAKVKGKPKPVAQAPSNVGKIVSVNMGCPYCGETQPLAAKSTVVTCVHCQKKFMIPKKVLEFLD